MTALEIINLLTERKTVNLQLAKSYNSDKSNKIAKQQYYHCVISYNEIEAIIAKIEDRTPMGMFFIPFPKLDEDTLNVQIRSLLNDNWHYPSKDDLPKDSNEVILATDQNQVFAGYYNGVDWYSADDFMLGRCCKVLAWHDMLEPPMGLLTGFASVESKT